MQMGGVMKKKVMGFLCHPFLLSGRRTTGRVQKTGPPRVRLLSCLTHTRAPSARLCSAKLNFSQLDRHQPVLYSCVCAKIGWYNISTSFRPESIIFFKNFLL